MMVTTTTMVMMMMLMRMTTDPSNDRKSSGESLRVVPVTAEGGGECVQERAVKPEE